jgi:hypothetical protein
MNKAPVIENLLSMLSKKIGGSGRDGIHCSICNKEVKDEEFKDELSRKEYKISQMCQKCQDRMFS